MTTDGRDAQRIADLREWERRGDEPIFRASTVRKALQLKVAYRARAIVAETALAAERAAREVAERTARRRDRQWALSRQGWVKAARSALNGDLSDLRNRVAMYDAGPIEILNGEEQHADRALDPEAAR